MANESFTCHMTSTQRLIDANALCEFFQERYEYLRNASETQLPNGNVQIDLDIQVGAIIAKEFLDKAKQAKTVDAVEVVRCKDCVHMKQQFNARFCEVWCLFNGDGDEGFCNYGERKKDEVL